MTSMFEYVIGWVNVVCIESILLIPYALSRISTILARIFTDLYSLFTLLWIDVLFCLRIIQSVLTAVLFVRIPKTFVAGFHFTVGVAVAVWSQIKLNTLFVLSYMGILTPAKSESPIFLERITNKRLQYRPSAATERAVQWSAATYSAAPVKYFGWDMTFFDNLLGLARLACNFILYIFRGDLSFDIRTSPYEASVLSAMGLPPTTHSHDLASKWEVYKRTPVYTPLTSIYVDDDFPGGPAIIVAVRGSIAYRDWLTDFNCNRGYALRKFKGEDGRGTRIVHQGIYKSAQNVCDEITLHLTQSADIQRSYDRIVVTGHSLGGGITVYLTGLLQQRFPDMTVFGYAFAPPGVLTKQDIATNPIENLECYMFSQDIVPRLSQDAMTYMLMQCYECGRQLFGGGSVNYGWNVSGQMSVPNPIMIFPDGSGVAQTPPPFNPFTEGFLECVDDHCVDNYVAAIEEAVKLRG